MPACSTCRGLRRLLTVATRIGAVYIDSNFETAMRPILIILHIHLLLFLLGQTVYGQFASGNHFVTVSVTPLSLLQLSGGTVNLDISGAQAVAGQDQMTVTNNATQLLWGTNSSAQKITAVSDLATPLFTLRVEATAPTQGIPAGPVTLTATAGDLLLNIGRSSGTCTIVYTSVILASQGTGTESHNITFTIQTQ